MSAERRGTHQNYATVTVSVIDDALMRKTTTRKANMETLAQLAGPIITFLGLAGIVAGIVMILKSRAA